MLASWTGLIRTTRSGGATLTALWIRVTAREESVAHNFGCLPPGHLVAWAERAIRVPTYHLVQRNALDIYPEGGIGRDVGESLLAGRYGIVIASHLRIYFGYLPSRYVVGRAIGAVRIPADRSMQRHPLDIYPECCAGGYVGESLPCWWDAFVVPCGVSDYFGCLPPRDRVVRAKRAV